MPDCLYGQTLFSMKPKIVILTGAGISAESGIKTFRDANGLWNNYDIMEVASPQGWKNHPEIVLDFYNQRRRQLHEVLPNNAHLAITKLQKYFDVNIITQNVDDLHERAGNKNVLHLHGELFKVRSENNDNFVYEWKKDLKMGDLAEDGGQLRPHIVWFGESVPMITEASKIAKRADIFIIIGTGMQVYPAAGLVQIIKPTTEVYYIDIYPNPLNISNKLEIIKGKAGKKMPELVDKLISVCL